MKGGRTIRATVTGLALGLAVAPAGLRGQSLLGIGNLGFPVEPVDARGRALGNVGVGLFGPAILPTDPAAAADLRIGSVSLSFQTSWVDLEGPADPSATATRFPLIGVAYPVGRLGMATLTFGGVLDQRWRTRVEREIELGEEFARVTDTFESDGGVSAVRLGFARRIAPSLAVGVSVGRLTGEVTRSFNRTFDSLSVGGEVPPFVIGGAWNYGAPTASAGATVDVGDVFRASASLSWSGTLEADPTPETDGGPAEFDIPVEYRVGASGVLAPGLNLVTALSWADWSSTADESEVAGSASLSFGAGLEWDGANVLGRPTPLRFGYRRSDLPFRFGGEEGDETAWTAGLGLNFVEQENVPLARVDFALERGERSAGVVSESFWRSSVTLRVAGF